MRPLPPSILVAAATLVLVLAGTAAVGAPPPVAPPILPTSPAAVRYEYAVRCVFRGAETAIVANYKLRCNELGSEVSLCPPLEYEACRLKVINDMGAQGWRWVGADEVAGLGPGNSLTFERVAPAPVVP